MIGMKDCNITKSICPYNMNCEKCTLYTEYNKTLEMAKIIENSINVLRNNVSNIVNNEIDKNK